MKKFLFLLLCASSLRASQETFSAASAVDPLLSQGVSARALGMGSAFTAVADDASALYWNPAGLRLLKQGELSFNHTQDLADISQDGAVVAFPWGPVGLGLGLNYVNFGSFDNLDDQANLLGSSQETEAAFRLGLGWSLVPGLEAGLALETLSQSLDSTTSLRSVDAGLLWAISQNLSAGLSASVPGSDAGAGIYRGGVAWKGWKSAEYSTLLALDGSLEPDGLNRINAGLELHASVFALRAGYQLALASADAAGQGGLSLGLGVDYQDFIFDYAYLPYGDLGSNNRLSLSYRLPGPLSAGSPPAQEAGLNLHHNGAWSITLFGSGLDALNYAPLLQPDSDTKVDACGKFDAGGGIEVGFNAVAGYFLESGFEILAPRSSKISQYSSGTLDDEFDETVLPMSLYVGFGRRWEMATSLDFSLGSRLGYGLLFGQLETKIPDFADETVAENGSAVLVAGFVRMERRFAAGSSLGMELGYQLLDFSNASDSGQATSAYDFSGAYLRLRLTTTLPGQSFKEKKRLAVAAPLEAPAMDAKMTASVNQAEQLRLDAATASQVGDAAKALSMLEQSVKLDPASAKAWTDLGQAYQAGGRDADAVKAYEEALSNDPDNLELKKYIKRLKALAPQNVEKP